MLVITTTAPGSVEVQPGNGCGAESSRLADWRAGRSTVGAVVNGENGPRGRESLGCLDSEKQHRLILRNETPETRASRRLRTFNLSVVVVFWYPGLETVRHRVQLTRNLAAPRLPPVMDAPSNHHDPPRTQLRPQAFLLFRDSTRCIWCPVCARIFVLRSALQTRPQRKIVRLLPPQTTSDPLNIISSLTNWERNKSWSHW
ncbi:hypothetical protein B0T16DRAFT_248480 [Cercophora newfieldiana]|uniref:Uncharacterized protein n=1 Tax=Cercophora newfieldiana TaxID=92897 RepID=A0AA39XT73_9PEZI|nr:hypothetical protein B0T16DRAFT_248480 [Cercophora newfieldiana]